MEDPYTVVITALTMTVYRSRCAGAVQVIKTVTKANVPAGLPARTTRPLAYAEGTLPDKFCLRATDDPGRCDVLLAPKPVRRGRLRGVRHAVGRPVRRPVGHVRAPTAAAPGTMYDDGTACEHRTAGHDGPASGRHPVVNPTGLVRPGCSATRACLTPRRASNWPCAAPSSWASASETWAPWRRASRSRTPRHTRLARSWWRHVSSPGWLRQVKRLNIRSTGGPCIQFPVFHIFEFPLHFFWRVIIYYKAYT